MKLHFSFFIALLFGICAARGSEFYAISNGNWSNTSTWSLSQGGSPASKVPKKGDVIYIGNYDIILDMDMTQEPGIELDIEEDGSLISQSDEGIYVKTQGFLNVAGILTVGSIDTKNDATVVINVTGVLTTGSFYNVGTLIVNGEINVTGTFTNTGTVSGVGTITAADIVNSGTLFCDSGSPGSGTHYGQEWFGGASGAETDWNDPANWCSGRIPDDTAVVLIADDSYMPVISGHARCRRLVMKQGASLKINPGASLCIEDTLRNHGHIHIESTAAGSGALVHRGLMTGNGTFRVDLYLSDSSSSSMGFAHQVCAPVDNAVLNDFNVVPGSTYGYEYNGATNEWVNIANNNQAIPPMKGILLSTLNSNNTPHTISFNDDIVTGFQSTAITANAWNLVGNPYPSPISWDSINPQGDISNTVYIWNPSARNFMSYVEGTGGNNSCRYIQPGQAFFIYSYSGSSFELDNNVRVSSLEPYLKSSPANYLRLYTGGGDGHSSDETYIRFMSGATPDYDEGMESDKWPSMSETPVTELYTQSADGLSLQINAMPLFHEADVAIPLHFKAALQGDYSINTDGLASFDASISIYLEDKFYYPSLMYNLSDNGVYTFNASPADDADRFVLHFMDEEFSIIEDGGNSPIRIISHTNSFTIDNPEGEEILDIRLYSLDGKELTQYPATSSYRSSYAYDHSSSICIVRLVTAREVISHKLFSVR